MSLGIRKFINCKGVKLIIGGGTEYIKGIYNKIKNFKGEVILCNLIISTDDLLQEACENLPLYFMLDKESSDMYTAQIILRGNKHSIYIEKGDEISIVDEE